MRRGCWHYFSCILLVVALMRSDTLFAASFAIFQVAGPSLGFTTVVPTAPVCQGINLSCGGSQVIYISRQSGTDSGTIASPGATGTCTQAAPCQTLNYGCSLIRNNSADQLLLKGGDIWPTTDPCGKTLGGTIGNLNGLSSCNNVGGSCNGPILFGYYNGSAGRPEVDTSSSTGCWKASAGSGSFDNIVIQGWYCHAIDRDPTASTYTFSGAGTLPVGIANATILTTWFLIEDVTLAYYGIDVDFAGVDQNTPNGTIIIRRSNIVHTYCVPICDSSGIFEAFTTTPTISDNFFYVTGWDDILSKPQAVTISGNTITWPIANYAFNALPFGNGSVLYFQATCGSASAGTGYTVASVSGATFVVQSGGSTVSLAGCSSATMMWGDAALLNLNHAVYFQVDGGAMTLTGNISLWSNDLKDSTGGTVTGNFTSNDVLGITTGASAGSEPPLPTPAVTALTLSQNVFQHNLAFFPGTGGKFSYPGDGAGSSAGGFNLNNASGSGVTMTNNIFSQLGTGSTGDSAIVYSCCVNGDTTNTVNQNNIVYGANSGGAFNTSNAGSGNVTTPQTCIDLSQANSGCADEPFPNPLNDLFSYDAATWGTSCSGSGPPNTCMTDFVNRQLTRLPGTWPSNLTAAALISHVKTGFGRPF